MALKKPEPPEEDGCPMWMVSFGDAMSLLVTFFVMLLSFASFEEAELSKLMGALKGGLNSIPSFLNIEEMGRRGRDGREAASRYERDMDPDDLSRTSPYDLETPKEHADQTIARTEQDEFFIRLLQEGLSLIIKTDSLFLPGTTEFLEHRAPLLGVITDMGAPADCEIRITSVVPANTVVYDDKTKTVWGLAAERAAIIQNKVMEISGTYPADRFSLSSRIEEPGTIAPGIEYLPPVRMEITFVGYRDIPKVMGADKAVIKQMLQ